jgi:hypothetical protein
MKAEADHLPIEHYVAKLLTIMPRTICSAPSSTG